MSMLPSRAGWRHLSGPNTLYLSYLVCIFARTRSQAPVREGRVSSLSPGTLAETQMSLILIKETLIAVQTGNQIMAWLIHHCVSLVVLSLCLTLNRQMICMKT